MEGVTRVPGRLVLWGRLGAVLAAACALLGGCAPDPPTSAESSAIGGAGAFIVATSPTQQGMRHPIASDGTAGPGAQLPWPARSAGEVVLLKDTRAGLALTATVAAPLTDVSPTKQLQVRDIGTGAVRRALDVPGWCSGPDGASYPCLLVGDSRVLHTTPVDGETPGRITVSSLLDGQELAAFGPFPALAGVLATDSDEVVVVVSADSPAGDVYYQALDLGTGSLVEIGRLPLGQPGLCVLGSDSVLTYRGKLDVIGPARVPDLVIPELEAGGPGAIGCSADSRFLYLETNDTRGEHAELVVDAVSLSDGRRTVALTVPTQSAVVSVTR